MTLHGLLLSFLQTYQISFFFENCKCGIFVFFKQNVNIIVISFSFLGQKLRAFLWKTKVLDPDKRGRNTDCIAKVDYIYGHIYGPLQLSSYTQS